VFFEDHGMIGAHPSLPSAEVIRASKVLFIDHLGWREIGAPLSQRNPPGSRGSRFEDQSHPLFREVLALVDHLILSEEIALGLSDQTEAAAAALALWHAQRAAVIVTCGAKGCWSVSAPDAAKPAITLPSP